MKFDFSVIVLTYHPDREKLLATLRSIIMQRNVRMEILVADDGTPDFCESCIHSFMAEHSFADYRVLAHEQNQGTVKNLLDAVAHARGKYIKPISPGDYLYDADTLKEMYDFMTRNDAKAAFGDMVYYFCDGALRVTNRKTPGVDRIYLEGNRNYRHRQAIKNQMVYTDYISGAAVAYENAGFRMSLEEIAGAVTYAEDTVMQLLAVKGERIYRIPRYVVWYEYGTGISTNAQLGFTGRVKKDFYQFYQMLADKYPGAPYIKRTLRLWRSDMEQKTRKYQILRCLELDRHVFRFFRHGAMKKYVCSGYAEDTFWNIVKNDPPTP